MPALLREAVEALAPRGTCGSIGAAAIGTDVSLDMATILTAGRGLRGIVEGDSVPQTLLPRLIELWSQGKFPVERMMEFYDFDQIDEAARLAEEGKVIKPVLKIGYATALVAVAPSASSTRSAARSPIMTVGACVLPERDERHDRRIGDAQPVDAVHAQLRVDDGLRRRRPSCRCRPGGGR